MSMQTARSEGWGLVAWILGSWVRIQLKVWMFTPVHGLSTNYELVDNFRSNSEMKQATRPNPYTFVLIMSMIQFSEVIKLITFQRNLTRRSSLRTKSFIESPLCAPSLEPLHILPRNFCMNDMPHDVTSN
jgi:hypothetical protein